jgi:hypothetical protein
MTIYYTKEVNCSTGEVIEREMTPKETAEHLELLKSTIVTDEEFAAQQAANTK